MDPENLDYAAWAQVVVAVVVGLATALPISNFIANRFFTIRTRCQPVGETERGLSTAWDVEFSNQSRLFGGFSIFLFPTTARNLVVAFQQISPNDGGMVVASEIIEGALEVRVIRFHKRRLLKTRVQFQRPDTPSFDAGSVRLVRRISSPSEEGAEIVLALVYQRLMLTMFVFFGVTSLIVFALIRGAWIYR